MIENTPAPTPTAPAVYRLGRVERRFRELADRLKLDPGALLQKLLAEGVTQNQIAEQLGCTRQAVGVLGRRYGLVFPGARANLNVESLRLGYPSFKAYYTSAKEDQSQGQIADSLGVSLSTVKRRAKSLGI